MLLCFYYKKHCERISSGTYIGSYNVILIQSVWIFGQHEAFVYPYDGDISGPVHPILSRILCLCNSFYLEPLQKQAVVCQKQIKDKKYENLILNDCYSQLKV